MGTPATQSGYTSYTLKLVTDPINNNFDIMVSFIGNATPKFNGNIDAELFPGAGSDQSIAEISSDSIYTSMKWLPLPKKANAEVIKLNVTAKTSGLYTVTNRSPRQCRPFIRYG